MVVAHFDQCCEDIIPGLLFQHDIIWEHATIPADMLKGFGEFSVFIAQPITCMSGNIQFTVGVKRLTMSTGFIM
jgi:hypothetical protein